jgi:hypothetical protein
MNWTSRQNDGALGGEVELLLIDAPDRAAAAALR